MFRAGLAVVDGCAGGALLSKRPCAVAESGSAFRPAPPRAAGSRSDERPTVGTQGNVLRGGVGWCSRSHGTTGCSRTAALSDSASGLHNPEKRRTAVVASFLPNFAGWLGSVVPSTQVSMDIFQGSTVGELENWLQQAGLDTSAYGTPPAKSIAELLEEVELGESLLQIVEGNLVRVVSVLNVFIKNKNGEVLMEEHQVRPCGTVRARGLPLSEKLKAGEDWHPAVHRAIHEELGSVLPDNPKIEIMSHTYRMAVETRTSNSYPGLHSQYHCHRVYATVEGLPQTQRFVSTEPRPNGILQNHWIWQSLAP
mmetsp:Transcript_691/g.2077  ORF Transcript_691/g.2077 Transcript_691/m.2077 type:complete len:310 (-) Transcript_691:201-1130(-)